MNSIFTRRTALSLIGVSSATALAACGSASLVTTGSPGKENYQGEVVFDNYDTSAGVYKPATRTERPQNVPKPILPANNTEQSIGGLYSTIGFYAAAIQYLLTAFDSEPLEQLMAEDKDKRTISQAIETLKSFNIWFADLKVTITLTAERPTKDGDTYTWPATVKINTGEFGVYQGTAHSLSDDEQSNESNEELKAQYKDGKWVMLNTGKNSNSVPGMNI